MTPVHVVVPDGIDDPARPSGGNIYDRRVCRGLAAIGWSVHEHAVPGDWPRPDEPARACLTAVLAALPDHAVVLLDGLIASTVPNVLLPQADRLRLVVLVHTPVDDPGESAVLNAAAAIVTTSDWTRRRLLDRYAVRPDVFVAEPGVDLAGIAPGTPSGGELLCVAAVTPLKGHDVLLDALALVGDPVVRCLCVGSLTRDPSFARGLCGRDDRVRFAGPLTGDALAAAYAGADVLVLASRAETYGMVVTEALARGLPVIASDVGGLPQTLGGPGLLVEPGSAVALADALRTWLGDADLRQRLRAGARTRRATLTGWPVTTDRVARVLARVA